MSRSSPQPPARRPRPDWDSAFGDIVSNLLGVMLIITVLALIAGLGGQLNQARDEETKDDLLFAPPPHERFPPWSEYWVVKDGRFFRLELDAIVDEIANNRLTPKGSNWVGRTAQLEFLWEDERALHTLGLAARIGSGDADTYRLRMTLSSDWLASQSMAGSEDAALALLTERQQADPRRVPGIFVYASGFDLFSRLQPLLIRNHLRYRWTAHLEEEPMMLYRDPSQFTADDFRR